jgi:hypothetical protein
MDEYQLALLQHMRSFPNVLPKILVERVSYPGVVEIGDGDFIVQTIPTRDLSWENIHDHGYDGPHVLFLITPSIEFVYNPNTGKEICHTIRSYNIDRTKLLSSWKKELAPIVDDLRRSGLEHLVTW